MAIPTTKDELLQAIRINYSKLVCELSDIPNDQTNLLILQGHAKGTVMSINNLISYLISWGELVLKWNKKSEDGKEVDFPETGTPLHLIKMQSGESVSGKKRKNTKPSLDKYCYSINTYIFITMGNLLYTIAVILVLIWAISFFGGFVGGGLIHILLVIAIIAVLLRVIKGNA